jgi:6-phosphogluconolactonase
MLKRTTFAVLVLFCGCDSESADSGNDAGRGGSSGSSASGGTSGAAGKNGSGGSGGSGAAGAGGAGGAQGSSGSTGSGGSSGSSGSGGGDSGSDAPIPEQAWFVYTGSGDGTISIFRMDRQTGELTPAGTADGGNNPSYLAWDPSHRYLYAVNEGSPGRVVAFSINQSTGALSPLNDESSSGNGPAHVSVDQSGKWVLVANYASGSDGTVGVLPIGSDGSLGAPVDSESFGQNSNPHLIITSPDNAYAFVPCKGRDMVAQFRFDATSGALTANSPASVAFDSGAGPRHLAFDPSGRFAYVVGELDSTLSALARDAATGRLSMLETESSLPSGFTGSNTGADVRVHPSGSYVYSSNRGHDSIAIFAIDAQGRISSLGHEPTQGDTPRNFHIDPAGTFLLVANQGSDTVVTLRIESDGTLSDTGHSVDVDSPAFVGVVTQEL